MPKKKGFFIVFEGIEGSGKSFQINRLYKKLKKKNLKVIKTREPGGTKSSELIRNLILKDYFEKDKKEKFDKYTDTLLYLAARNEHIKNKIEPALKAKKVVICDRFINSTYAYQVVGKKVEKKFIDNIHKKILRGVKPDMTFILKTSMTSSTRRLKKRKLKNRYDKFKRSFYISAQKAFLSQAKNKKDYFVLDSSKDDTTLEKIIFKTVYNSIKLRHDK